jgi:hypothetical protein
MKFFLAIATLLTLTACPPAPVSPTNDASDASPVIVTDAGTFEQNICATLADAGCASAKLPSCPAAIAANKIPGGYVTSWAACLYSGTSPLSCGVPCQ